MGLYHISPGFVFDRGIGVLAQIYELFIVSLHVHTVVGMDYVGSVAGELSEVTDKSVKLVLGRHRAVSVPLINLLPWDWFDALFNLVVENWWSLLLVLFTWHDLFHQRAFTIFRSNIYLFLRVIQEEVLAS